MQKIFYLILLLLLSIFAKANEIIVLKKSFKKSFSVGANVTAEVHTNFGKVEYVIGKSGEVSYSVEVIVDGKNEKLVQEKLQSINIEFSKNGNTVKGQTTMQQMRAKNINVKINYIVYIPIDANVAIDANYVDVYLPNLQAKVKLDCNYTDVYITGEMSNFEMKSNYSDVKSNSLIKNINVNGNFNDFNFEKVSKILFDGNYSDIDIKFLNNEAVFTGNYSDFKILGMASENVAISIKGNYLDGIFYCNNAMEVNISGKYMEVKSDSRYHMLKNITSGTSKQIVAKTSSSTNSTLQISGNFSDINLK